MVTALFWIVLFSFIYIKTEKKGKIEYNEGAPLVFDSTEKVFVSDESEVYHEKDCVYVNENYYEIEKDRAEYLGKRPCKKCIEEK